MALKGKPISIGATDTTIYTCPATTEASIHGLVFANNTAGAVTITLKVYIQSLGTTTTVATGLSVAANSTYTWPKPVDVNAGDYVVAVASTGSAIVCLYSVYEGSAVAAAVGFTPRGTWGSGSTYAVNDVVSLSGSSYLAIQASTNQNPSTATAYWLILASKGDTGATGTNGTNGTNGTGDVVGPASSTDNAVARYDSTTGKLLQNSLVTVADDGAITAPSVGSVIPFYYANQAAFPSAATYHGAIVHSHADAAMYFAHSSAWVEMLKSGGALGTPASGTLSSCTVDGTDGVGFRNVPINSQSAAYTAVLADSGKTILHPSTDANARTFTIPANASVAYPLGTVLTFINMTSQVVTIAITSDTLYLAGTGTTGSRTLAQYGMASAIKMTSTTWIVSGNGVT